jgi:prepilin-type N-terminal cleavage/methylation domain-containing protein
MTKRLKRRRAAFTLLEMVLALAIGVVLMLGLYLTLDLFFKSVESGRTNIEQAQVTEKVCSKFTTDVIGHRPMLPNPTSGNSGGGSGGGGTGSTSGTGSASSTSGSSSGSTMGSSSTGSSTGGAASTATTSGPFPYNLGVQGGTDYCSIYIGRVPRSNFQVDTANSQSSSNQNTQPTDSDLRRIDYWYVYGDENNSGLARQEVVMVTNTDDINNMPPGIADEASYIFAKEVIAVTFEYFDGTSWQSSWDGTIPGPDGVTPVGPPLAIAMTISVARSDVKTTDVSDPSVVTTRHVVHIPTALVNPTTAPQGSGSGG